MLGALLFNIFLNDISLFINNTYLCKYADDNTINSIGNSFDKLKLDLQTKMVFENHMFFNLVNATTYLKEVTLKLIT